MDRRLALAATVLVGMFGGCWGAPKPSTPPLMMPPPPLAAGLVWQSPAQPWHLRHVTSSLAIAGDVAMIGSDHGWITRMDLRTGRITGEKQLDPTLAIQGLAALPGQRWFVVGHGEKAQRLWTLDGATLDASVVELANDKRVGTTAFEVAVLADGNLVITGRGLPLAIYDARTFAVRNTLDPELGWSHPRAVGTSLYAEQRYRGHRFELATGARIQLPVRVEITPTTNLQEVRKGSTAVVARLDGAVATPLPEEIDTFATGPTETFVTVRKTQLQIRTAPTGEIVRRVELGASARGVVATRPVVDATRAVFDAGAILRVVDLATGTITPEGAPPWGRDNRVALDAAGVVLATGTGFAWQLAAQGPAGAVQATLDYAGHVHRTTHLGDATHVTLIDGKHVERRAVGQPTPRATWDLHDEPYDVWYGRDGTPVFDVLGDDGPLTRAVLVRDGAETPFVRFNPDAVLWDVDVDTGEALVVLAGQVGLARAAVPTAIHLRVPACDELAEAHLERGGKRALTVGERALAVWDRTTGALLGSATFDAPLRDQVFLPGRPELLVATERALGVWSPDGDLRALPLPGIAHVQVAPDGQRAVVGFRDGHVAVYEVAALRGQPLAPAPRPAVIPDVCGSLDPFDEPPVNEGCGAGDCWDGD